MTPIGELPMGLQVVFLPFRASLSTIFHNNCDRGKSLRTTTCLKSVVGVSMGMFPVKNLRSNKASFASVESHGDHKTVIKLGESGHHQFRDITGFKAVVSDTTCHITSTWSCQVI